MISLAKVTQHIQSLGTSEKQILRYIVSQAGEAPVSDIQNRWPESPVVLESLKTLRLIELNDLLVRVPMEYRRLVSLTPIEKSTLAYLLASLPANVLQTIAAKHNVEWGEKTAVIHSLKKILIQPDYLNQLQTTFSEGEQILWQRIVSANGK